MGLGYPRISAMPKSQLYMDLDSALYGNNGFQHLYIQRIPHYSRNQSTLIPRSNTYKKTFNRYTNCNHRILNGTLKARKWRIINLTKLMQSNSDANALWYVSLKLQVIRRL